MTTYFVCRGRHNTLRLIINEKGVISVNSGGIIGFKKPLDSTNNEAIASIIREWASQEPDPLAAVKTVFRALPMDDILGC